MKMEPSFFEEETRHGFFITPFMKRCWASQMEILQGIDDICRKYNIRWFAHYGTMLGAVRHGGFVPWDDDMDICMLREDFERFGDVLRNEDTELFLCSLREDCTDDEYSNIIARVLNSDHILDAKMAHEKYHDSFFACGVDIFVLDYVSKDEKYEKNRADLAQAVQLLSSSVDVYHKILPEVRKGIKDLEYIYNYKFDLNKPLRRQFFMLVDKEYKKCPVGSRSDGVAVLQEVYNSLHKPPFHVQGYDNYYEVPFEMMKVRLSRGFLEMMKIYYYNFALYWRGGGGHEYPYYEKQLAAFTEHQLKIPFSYTFTPEDLPDRLRNNRMFPKDELRKLLSLLDRCISILGKTSGNEDDGIVKEILENMQQLSIKVGNLLERVRGTEFPAVHLMEQFCEDIYQTYVSVGEWGNYDTSEGTINRIEDLNDVIQKYQVIKKEIEQTYLNRKEILIIPYRAKYWYAIQTVYKKYLQDDNTDVYVMPVPLHYRDVMGNFLNTSYEGKLYPEDVSITNYQSYNLESRIPDKIYIQTPYDDKNPVISVEPSFYSERLAQCTPCLVYMPWMLLDENLGNDILLEKELRLSGCMPGVIHADQVFLQSERIKGHFLNVLKKFVGEEYLPVIEKKLITESYPVIEYIRSLETISEKKRDFYYISIAGVLYEGDKYFDGLEEEIRTLLSNNNEISLVVEKRAETTLKTVDLGLYEKLSNKVNDLEKDEHIEIYIEPETAEERASAIAQHDQYFGDQGPMTWLFYHFKKTVRINTIDYNKLS